MAPPLFLLLCLVLVSGAAQAAPFKCSSESPATCKALVGYVSPNATTLTRIQTLFNGSADLPAANDLDPSTPGTKRVAAGQLLKIPFRCRCSNGTGLSDRVPVYTVVPEDGLENVVELMIYGLFHIANDVFGALIPFDEIQKVNNIPNANLIYVGQPLWIPLPCSCDDVGGKKVVHYGHLVANHSTIEGIAQQFGTTQDELAKLNGLAGPNDLIAGSVIDVPLRVCDSNVRADSPDYPLLVPNGTYALTANDCVRCNCNASNNYKLDCRPSQIKPKTWATCPIMQCQGSVASELGNTTSNSSCSSTTCAYTGYSSQNISTTLAESTCPGSGDKSWAGSIEASWKQLFPILILAQILVFVL